MAFSSVLPFVQNLPKKIPTVCLAVGEEVQLLEEARFALRRQFKTTNIQRLDINTLSDRRIGIGDSKGLFGEQAPELFEVIGHGTPPTDAIELLTSAANRLQSPDTLLIVLYDIDYKQLKSAWFRKISAVAPTCLRAERLAASKAAVWIKYWLNQEKITLSDDAIRLLSTRTEGNLVAAKQAIIKLSLQGEKTLDDEEWVSQTLSDGAQYDIFNLAETVLSGQATRALTMMRQLRFDGIADPLILWSLTDILNNVIALKSGATARAWGERLNGTKAIASASDNPTLSHLLQQAVYADRINKGVATGDIETALTGLIVNLAAIRRNVKITLPTFQA